MLNLYSHIRAGDHFRKLEVDELLFVEYTCLQEETRFGIWSDSNYFAFVTSGKKAWKTIGHDYEVSAGEILFIKKGANLTHQFFGDQFCAIFIFIPDDFIKSFLRSNSGLLESPQVDLTGQDAVLRVASNELLEMYRDSVVSYLSLSQLPDARLLKLKIEELLLSLCASDEHASLKDYFISLCQDQHYHMSRVMEENFGYNLKLEDYARLCHMSLSTFKKNFKQYFGTTPAAWLKQRKLELAAHRLRISELPVNQLSFECGFEDPSHFTRVFKDKFECTPLEYRKSQALPD